MQLNDTICAISTSPGMGAIAIVRISGKEAWSVLQSVFYLSSTISSFEPYRIYKGEIRDDTLVLDEVLVSVFKSPHSYTGEDLVEISCHGSTYIQRRILELLIRNKCRLAEPGEFTLRAFVNGKMDLSQAEAVGDLIASQSKMSHQLSMQQLRGGFSLKIKELREQLLHFSSLLELELDFGEEDVEFANREEIKALLTNLKNEIQSLIDSFLVGNVFKNGIPVAIAGKPNVGKSTLLNVLLNEDRAIVSDIPGTTRDTIEDCMNIHGFTFRFIDTAGLRATSDEVEKFGIERSYQAMEKAMIILYLFDDLTFIEKEIAALEQNYMDKKIIAIVNKSDMLQIPPSWNRKDMFFISAKKKINIEAITTELHEYALSLDRHEDVLVSNTRHYEALQHALTALLHAETAFENQVSTDLIMIDIRGVLYHLGSIIGEVSTDDILGSIFENFCIGK
ncbi:MAG: tRNA uridine-5-carboxymethylaminomethyl(34) synthesis GTPase MnmE [Bacteroidales bacterium]|nr:tRNA uridine-5-carboxymethylaminomethyl(34) synthesis GTPase MnmE [Bacteroidales bacterium]